MSLPSTTRQCFRVSATTREPVLMVAQHRDNRSPIAEPIRVGEHYRRSRLLLHLHLRWYGGWSDSKLEELCAILHRPKVWLKKPLDLDRITIINPDGCVPKPCLCDDDHAVFVDVVEFRDEPEALCALVKSLVLLQPLHFCDGTISNERLDVARRGLESLLVGMDQECQLPRFSGFGFHAVDNSQSEGKIVEGTTQVVDGIPDSHPQVDRQRGEMRNAVIRFPVRLYFEGDRIGGRYCGVPSGKEWLEVVNVLASPLDFAPDLD